MVKALVMLLMSRAFLMLAVAQQAGDPATNLANMQPLVNASQGADLVSSCAELSVGDQQMFPIEKVCDFALTFRHNLPDFTCEQTTVSTCEQTPMSTCSGMPGNKGPALRALVTFLNGKENYSNVTIGGKAVPANRAAEQVKLHLLTRGEFGSDLVRLFTPPIAVEFKFHKETTFHGKPVLVYEFDLPADKNTFWTIYDAHSGSVKPELRGELWIEPETGKLLRLQVEPVHLPPQFDIKSGSTTIDYAEVSLGDAGVFLLPVASQTNACIEGYEADRLRPTLACINNVITFQSCHKFTARTRIVPIQ